MSVPLNVCQYKKALNASCNLKLQKQPPRSVIRKRCSENMQQGTGEHPCRSMISIKLLCIFIEIAFRHGSSPKNTSGRLLLMLGQFYQLLKRFKFTNALLLIPYQ